MTGKPLVVHVHSTEFDRSGEHVNQMIYDIERKGMHAADRIIAVSHLTRNIIISRYGIPGEKVEVVYNGVERNGNGKHHTDLAGSRILIKMKKSCCFSAESRCRKGRNIFWRPPKKCSK